MSAEQATFNQLNQQPIPATVLVPRSNGEISTGMFAGQYNVDGKAIVHVETEDGRLGYKPVGHGLLSDQNQEKLAAELAAALRTSVEGQGGTRPAVGEPVEARVSKMSQEEWGRRERAADHRYNLAIQSGATPEEAQKSADRAWR